MFQYSTLIAVCKNKTIKLFKTTSVYVEATFSDKIYFVLVVREKTGTHFTLSASNFWREVVFELYI